MKDNPVMDSIVCDVLERMLKQGKPIIQLDLDEDSLYSVRLRLIEEILSGDRGGPGMEPIDDALMRTEFVEFKAHIEQHLTAILIDRTKEPEDV